MFFFYTTPMRRRLLKNLSVTKLINGFDLLPYIALIIQIE